MIIDSHAGASGASKRETLAPELLFYDNKFLFLRMLLSSMITKPSNKNLVLIIDVALERRSLV